jgi:ATP-dependent DNA helicase RecG
MSYYRAVRHSIKEIRSLLQRLDSGPADLIESETLECKPWNSDAGRLREQIREIREYVVCFANSRGGALLLGIQDRKRTKAEAISGVGDLKIDVVRKAIYDGTDPHILADIEELIEPEGRLLIIHVPEGLGIHTTSEGVAKVRVGKDCQPLTGSMLAQRIAASGETDRTALPASRSTVADLDPDYIRQLQRTIATEGRKPELARLQPDELLGNIGLVHQGEVSLAAVLLLGRSPAMARWAPQHEVVFIRYATQTRADVRYNLKGPIILLVDRLRELLAAHLRIASLEAGGFGELSIPDLTWWAAREAILNALVHRDYYLRQSIYVELRPDRVEISSPGGFIGGISAENILRHPPVRRNPLLADALEAAGFVNRAGMGVDRIYEELLRMGKGLPRYQADETTVRLILPTKTHESFARFVAEETRKGRPLELDDLILLRVAADRGELDRWSAAERLQCVQEEAAERLMSLRERGYLVPRGRGRGTAYQFARGFSDLVRGRLATDDGIPFDQEAVRLRIQAILSERGRLTNAEVRRLSGYSRIQALRLMRRLQDEDLVSFVGLGRSAHYQPGPKLKHKKPKTRQSSPKQDPDRNESS